MLPRAPSLLLAAAFLSTLAACGSETLPPTGDDYHVTIRRTAYGIPHIKADDLGSLAYGLGYAAAQDYGCYLADQIVKIRSKRAAIFGRGDQDANVASDFAYKALDLLATAAAELPKQPKDVRDLFAGYVAGYNRWLADTAHLPAPCTGASWVTPITDVELEAYALDLALRGSAVAFLDYIGNARPPGAASAAPSKPPAPPRMDLHGRGFGSNAWAIGRDRSESGAGLVLANPHFPWEGEIHWHEAHLTVPGKLDVYGASILGSPVIQIGFNQDVAWTHTVAPSQHLTVYKLSLAPGDPTTYLVDGKPHAMRSQEVSIDVKNADGSTTTEKRVSYRTDYGPMIAGPGLSWEIDAAFALRDANADDVRVAEQWLRIDQAKSVAEIAQALREVHGIPWVYTVAADRHGDALLVDASRVPNLSAATVVAYEEAKMNDPLTKLLAGIGVTLLDGSTSRDAWITSGEPYADGLVPVASAPALLRQDFVMNANDAPWATNPAAPLTGYSFLYGPTMTPLLPRTRMNLELLTETGPLAASGPDGKFTATEIEAAIFNDRAIVAEQLREAVADRCMGAAPVVVDGESVDVGPACAAIAAWDGRYHLASRGAVMWRELLGQFTFGDVQDAGALYAVPFDPQNPIDTPNTLAPKPKAGDDPILVALAKGVLALSKAKLAPDARLGDAQFTMKGDKRIPVPGGQDLEGAANVVSYYGKGSIDTTLLPVPEPAMEINPNTNLTTNGYLCTKGSSFVMVAEMASDGPKARALLTTSESRDPSSPHYADQTEMFSREEFRDVLFTEEQIAKDPDLETLTLTAPR